MGRQRIVTPEEHMKSGFECLFDARSHFEDGMESYLLRMSEVHADAENIVNIKAALKLINSAYDEVSAIWENDIEQN